MSQVVSFSNYMPAARFDDVAWTQARVDEAETSSGPWTLIDTLDLSPLDTDPAAPATRNLTTELASDTMGLWYRLTFVDADGSTGQPSTPIQNIAATVVASFATAADLAERLGLTLTDDEETRATALLARASGLICDEAKQDIVLVEDDTLTRQGTTDERILLPERPVVSVASVTLDGGALTEGGAWYLDGNEIVRKGWTLMLGGELYGCRGFGWESQELVIVYTHGYDDDEIPPLLKEIAVEMVVRVWVNPGSVIQESIAGEGATYAPYSAPPRGLLVTAAEASQLRRMFGRKARSINIGG